MEKFARQSGRISGPSRCDASCSMRNCATPVPCAVLSGISRVRRGPLCSARVARSSGSEAICSKVLPRQRAIGLVREDAAPPRARSPRPEGLRAMAPAAMVGARRCGGGTFARCGSGKGTLVGASGFRLRESAGPSSFRDPVGQRIFQMLSARLSRSTPFGCGGCNVSRIAGDAGAHHRRLDIGRGHRRIGRTRKDRSCDAAARTGCGTSGRVSAASTSAISGARPFCFATASRTIAVTAACNACFGAAAASGKHRLHRTRAKAWRSNDLAFPTMVATLAARLPRDLPVPVSPAPAVASARMMPA